VTIYRITQEALNNICKHADAQAVNIKLWQNNGLHLWIADDGVGFLHEPRPNHSSGWGLRTMQERVHLLGGTIVINSQPAEGTTLSIWIPHNHTETVASESQRSLE